MATTSNSYTGNGSTTLYSITFPYLDTSDIKAQIDGVVTTAFSLANATQVQFSSAPANNAAIIIYRETSDSSLAGGEFFAGSSIRAATLNDNFNQTLYIGQEVASRSISSLGGTMDGQLVLGKDVNLTFEGSTDDAHETTLTTQNPTADRTITLPNVSGTVVTTGDTGSVSNGMLADPELQELATMSSGTASALADLSQAEVQAIDGITSSTAELNILDGVTASTAEINKLDGVTATTAEINYVDGVTSNVQAQLNAKQPLASDLTTLSSMQSGAATELASLTSTELDILDGATVTTAELNKLDGVTATTDELNIMDGVTSTTAELNILDGVTASTTEINKLDGLTASTTELNIIDGVTATTSELNLNDGQTATPAEVNILDGATLNTSEINKLDGFTGSTADLNEVVAGKNVVETITGGATDAQIPTAQAVNERVVELVTEVGGFHPIANETSFPTTNPDINDGAGTIVSLKSLSNSFSTGSGVTTHTFTNGAGSGNNVTITGLPASSTFQAGKGLLLETTSTLHTYTYHRLVLDEAGVSTADALVSNFNEKYYGPFSSNQATKPSGANRVNGDLYFNTSDGKMKVFNGSHASGTWDDVAAPGNFFINTLSSSSGSGGGSATFNGTATRFTLSNPPNEAQQLLVSVNGVIQKPNSGTSPSEGFAVSGADIIFASAPASNAPFFIVTIGSSVNIGTPSDNTVTSAKIVDGSIVNADISSSAGITGSKLADNSVSLAKLEHGTSSNNGKFLRANNGADPSFETVSAATGNANAIQTTDGSGNFTASNTFTITGDIFTGHDILLAQDSGNNNPVISPASQASITLRTSSTQSGTFGSILDSTGLQLGRNSQYVKLVAPADQSGQTSYTLTFPTTAGSNGQALTTNGSGTTSWTTISSDLVDDSSPQLGGDLDANGQNIAVDGGNNITIGDNGRLRLGDSQDLDIYHSGTDSYINNTTGHLRIFNGASNKAIVFSTNSNNRFQISDGGHLIPSNNNSYDLGDPNYRWRNIYTNDLNLSNEGSSNDVDGTWGNWTIQEGESDLFLKNNRSGKKYKFNLTEVS